MVKIFCCLVLAGAGLFAQSADPVARLNPVLSKALAHSEASGELTSALMLLRTPARPVSADEVGRLANALSGAVAGREVNDAQVAVVSRCVAGLLQGGEASNFALAARLRNALTALRVGDERTDLIVRRFVAIGGPDDYPVKRNEFLQQKAK